MIEHKKQEIEFDLIKRYSLDTNSSRLLDNVLTYAIGNAFMVGYEDTKEFLLFMLDGVVDERDTLDIMHHLFQ
jgi:hypothetical protein